MAVKPPQFANGIPGNDSTYAPELWGEVQPSQNETISRNDMVYTSTVEYKGYYKAQSTGFHKFQLTGGADGFAWVSSANSNSDHIDIQEKVELVADTSFGIRIPAKPAGANYWVFQDTGNGVLGGTFPGYGYWPLEGYGTSTKWAAYFNSKSAVNYNHGAFFPGDIRTYNTTSNTSYGTCTTYCQGEPAGPGWNNSEDTNWNDEDLHYPCDSDWTGIGDCRQEGRGAQVYLSEAYVAGGSGKKGLWENPPNGEPFMVWPIAQPMATGALQAPERVQIYWKLKFKEAGNYKLRFTTKYGVKMWYNLTPNQDDNGNGGARSVRRLDPDGGGSNPISSGGGSFTSGVLQMSANQRVQLVGSATGNQATGDIGVGLEVLDADDEDKVIWDTSSITAESTALIGISECGYHALLDDVDRIPSNGISEFYKNDGWLEYDDQGRFNADIFVGDLDQRSERDTRQYLWENCTALLYDSQSRPGFVYLRQDDFYFIRVVVTNNESGTGQGFAFQVTDPGSNTLQQVVFSGNGDPNQDATVGGGVGGSGVPINKDALCNSVLFSNNVPNTSTTFGLITRTRSVLNLTALGVPEAMLGTEGQSESIGGTVDVEPGADGIGSYIVNVGGTNIRLAVLLQGGENGIPAMTSDEISAVITVANSQLTQGLTLEWQEFRNAITSQAVINYGNSGNYSYLYHAVGEVIQSICDDNFSLAPPEVIDTSAANNGKSLVDGSGDCVDLNIQGTIENSGYVSISSACVDECKPYDQYDIPSNMQAGLEDKTRYIATLPKYQESTAAGAEDLFFSQFSNSGQQFYEVDVVEGGDGKIMSWGFYVPDVLPSLTEDEYNERNGRTFNGKFFMSSNTYFKIPDDAEVENNSNYGPWVMCWVSLTPGGDPIGGREGVELYVGRGITGLGLNLNLTMEPYILNEVSGKMLYIGNTYGKRYFNFAMVKYENFVNDIYKFYGDPGVMKPTEDRLYPGDDGFKDMLSNAYFQTQQYSLELNPPKQKCTEGGGAGSRTTGSYPEPHDGSGLPSYVDYDPNSDFFDGRKGFALKGGTRRSLAQVYFEPCTVRSIPFLIIPGETRGSIRGVPRNANGEQWPGDLTGLSCPGSTLNDETLKSDGANYQPNLYTFGWFSRNPGEWDPDTIQLFAPGGEIEFVTRWRPDDDPRFNYSGFNITEPTWLYMNWAGFDYTLANNNPVGQNNPMEKVLIPDFNNLWPYRGFYWVKTDPEH